MGTVIGQACLSRDSSREKLESAQGSHLTERSTERPRRVTEGPTAWEGPVPDPLMCTLRYSPPQWAAVPLWAG